MKWTIDTGNDMDESNLTSIVLGEQNPTLPNGSMFNDSICITFWKRQKNRRENISGSDNRHRAMSWAATAKMS